MKTLALMVGAAIFIGLRVANSAEAPSAIGDLRREIAALREAQAAEIAAIQARTEARIAAIEARLAAASPASIPPAPPLAAASPPSATPAPTWQISGDLRLRYEGNFGAANIPDRERGVLRARLGARYDINEWLSAGARLTTGDADDPNSSDVTLTGFDDDLDTGLDLAYLRAHRGGFDAYGGKIPNPFARTELVWDGDVNPEGLSLAWDRALAAGKLRLTGLYFLIDEQAAGAESDMLGVQASLEKRATDVFSFELAAAYYDYTLGSIAGADAGDFRSNQMAPGGAGYLSDFNLMDVIAAFTLAGEHRPPLRVGVDVVRNFGAATDADTGYAVDLTLGALQQPHDWRLGYGYALAETDAVFAAFSQDNLPLATNYRQHALSFEWLLAARVTMSATWYHFRVNDLAGPPAGASPDWAERVRLNLQTQF